MNVLPQDALESVELVIEVLGDNCGACKELVYQSSGSLFRIVEFEQQNVDVGCGGFGSAKLQTFGGEE